MKNLMILVKMQLKEQFNFTRLDIKNVNLFQVLVSFLSVILKFALVTVLCAAFLIVSKLLGLFSFASMPIPSSVISLLFVVMLITSIFSCIVGLTKSMYYARDNAVLLTLPALPIQVYLSKLIIFFIFEIKRNFSFLVPLFIAYYITEGYGFFAYPWMIFCIIFVSLFTVSIGSLLSIPAMWIANFFRQHRYLQISGLVAIVGATILAVFFAISLIPADINLLETWNTTCWTIRNFFDAYEKNFAPIYNTTLIILRNTSKLESSLPFVPTLLRFLSLIGVTALLLAAGLFIVKPLFYKMASTPFEYLKKTVKAKKNVRRGKRFSAIYNEFLIALKTPSRMFSNVGILFSTPILVFLLNKIFLAINTSERGDSMIVAFNLLIILLVTLNANASTASVFSREGRSSYLIKTQPSKYPLLIISKLLPNMTFCLVSIVATYVILLLTTSIGAVDTTLLMLSVTMTYIAHMLYCADQDLMNPQFELYATVGASEINKNEMKATVTAFLIAFIAAGLSFVLLLGVGISVYLKFIVISLAAVSYRVYIFFSNLRVYYKEK